MSKVVLNVGCLQCSTCGRLERSVVDAICANCKNLEGCVNCPGCCSKYEEDQPSDFLCGFDKLSGDIINLLSQDPDDELFQHWETIIKKSNELLIQFRDQTEKFTNEARAEVEQLRGEVKQLTSERDELLDEVDDLTSERDELLDEVEADRRAHAPTLDPSPGW